MKKLAVLLITVLAFSAFGFTLTPDEKGPHNTGPKEKLIQELNLSPDQLSQFNEYHYNNKLMMIDTEAEIEKNMLQVKKMMMDNKVESDKILKLTETNNNLRSKMHTSKVKMWLDIYKILNKDQQELWTKHFGRMGERMHNKMECRKGMNFGPEMGKKFRNFDEREDMRPRDGRGRF